jgi:hypothetical protein
MEMLRRGMTFDLIDWTEPQGSLPFDPLTLPTDRPGYRPFLTHQCSRAGNAQVP